MKEKDFSHIERIFAISDLHTDYHTNLSWLQDRCRCSDIDNDINIAISKSKKDNDNNNTPGPNDILIIAGDISHETSVLKETLDLITTQLQCTIFFVPGNHEAWIDGTDMEEYMGITNSLQKLQSVQEMCQHMEHVQVHPHLVGTKYNSPVWLVPIQGWYDGSLTLPNCEDLSHDFATFPWIDFRKCVWPQSQFPLYGEEHEHYPHGRIPRGLVEYFINENESLLSPVRSSFTERTNNTPPGLITFSHFLPTQKVLPDWKDVNSNTFKRDEWLDHGFGGLSAKIAKVAGSSLLDDQIRSIVPTNANVNANANASANTNTANTNEEGCDDNDCNDAPKQKQRHRHLHVFGHTHCPKDVMIDNIRYIQNPLGNPREREMQIVNPNVDFQLIWDCRTTIGEIVAEEEIIRYWEQKGGGLQGLKENRERLRQKIIRR